MKSKILMVISILFGIMFVNSGLNKIFQYMPMPEDMHDKMSAFIGAFETIGWIMPLVAVVEIIGGVLMFFNKTRLLGAMMIFPIMVGILLTHIFNMPDGLIMAIILMVINLWVLLENKHKLVTLIK